MAKRAVKSGHGTSAQELKQYFLDNAYPIIDSYINAALGVEDLVSLHTGCREEVWETVKELMIASSDRVSLAIDSPRDIIASVESGACTFDDADRLLLLYQRVRELEAPSSTDAGGGGITIQILTSGGEVCTKPQRVIGAGDGAGQTMASKPIARVAGGNEGKTG